MEHFQFDARFVVVKNGCETPQQRDVSRTRGDLAPEKKNRSSKNRILSCHGLILIFGYLWYVNNVDYKNNQDVEILNRILVSRS